MKILAVETATACQSVAVLDGPRVLARSDEEAAGSQARLLIPTIDRLLKASGLTLSSLEGLAVSIGPGSFTGLRVGLATMMGLRAATGLPLAAVPTLEAMAWNVPRDDVPLCPILKARTGEVYWGLYRWTAAGTLQVIEAERVGSLEAVVRSFVGPTVVLGEGWATNRNELRRLLGPGEGQVREAPAGAMAASAVSVGLAGLERLARGDLAGQGLAPRYVQRAEAELTRDRHIIASLAVRDRVAPANPLEFSN